MSDPFRIVVDDTDYCAFAWFTCLVQENHPHIFHWCIKLNGHGGRCRCWDDGCRSWAERVEDTDE